MLHIAKGPATKYGYIIITSPTMSCGKRTCLLPYKKKPKPTRHDRQLSRVLRSMAEFADVLELHREAIITLDKQVAALLNLSKLQASTDRIVAARLSALEAIPWWRSFFGFRAKLPALEVAQPPAATDEPKEVVDPSDPPE